MKMKLMKNTVYIQEAINEDKLNEAILRKVFSFPMSASTKQKVKESAKITLCCIEHNKLHIIYHVNGNICKFVDIINKTVSRPDTRREISFYSGLMLELGKPELSYRVHNGGTDIDLVFPIK